MQAFPFDSELTYDEHNNPIYDRAVSSQPLRKLIKELFTTGVMPNPSTSFQVSAGNDGMTVQIAAGFAVIDGGLCRETETRTLEVTAADNTYDRIDTVVLRWNENVDVRNADLYVIAGTPAVNPVRPTLQRNNSIYEIGLADVFITKHVATITDDKITDTRYEAERCGIVSSISKFDTTTLYQQIQADLAGFKSTEQANFSTWYENIRNILDENVAGHLQNEINAVAGNFALTETGDTATRTYYTGNHVIWHGSYYKIKKTINIGDALVVDDNIERALVGEEIGALEVQDNSLNNKITNKVKLNGTAVSSINFELSGTTLTITTS